MTVEQKVSEAISRHAMVSPGATVAVALSGGADSVALLAAMHSLGYKCFALHCNFHLRGDESNRDSRHAEAIARQLGVPFHMKDIDVAQWQASHGGSLEMVCRESRYLWFEQMRQSLGAQAVAVAHNASDSVETFFLNLMRGSSSAGLKGIPWVRDKIIRPMLGVTRPEIELYLAEKGLTAITDSTNLENNFHRNRLRNIVIPAIKKEFPGATKQIARSMELLGRDAEFISYATAELIKPFINPNGSVALSTLASHPQAFMLLFHHLKPLGFNGAQVRQILDSANSSGAAFISGTVTLIIDRGNLSVAEHRGLQNIKIEILPISEFHPVRNANHAYFAPHVLEGEPLETRAWIEGDRIAPFGMKGTKLVSDLFNDAKIAVDRKKSIPLLVKNGQVLWVAGIRNSRLFKVDSSRHTCFVHAFIEI